MISTELCNLSGEILVGIANEHLRLNCKDQQALYYDLDISISQLEKKLSDAGFQYDALSNQYRALK
ncbi:DUF4250 domain-containing protein [Shewanella sp. UCD-KL12]|uniref:DUF4250 domain-containing protein n=1 Tax=Shewanella sp. UCD-KL12 TaxID=1917163 RepID=UPI000970836F|nr:DUF4250 domain-containing protein [Shewanella sp. UCD-KL12]